CELILYPAKVQGEGAAAEIVAGIECFGTRDDISTLIIGRGGGSIEDLWCFNEEAVATAIYNSHLPIISAVGHETDFTIADFVADLRAPTPSAAAEIAVPNSDDIKENLAGLYKRSLFALRADIEKKRELIKRFSVKSPIDVINIYRLRLDNLIEKKVNFTSNLLAKHKANLANRVAKLDALSPLKVMSRGYNFAVDSSGNVIKRALDMKADDKIILTFADGRASATVEEARRTQCAPTT
ncbi:MAG: exodeoxyribonuclease VII large subunit, partial [Oscillospiraceae bacterium]|nr:exodeoxyribonuclease VII large subunit [Oscillospiraceae bacterium]